MMTFTQLKTCIMKGAQNAECLDCRCQKRKKTTTTTNEWKYLIKYSAEKKLFHFSWFIYVMFVQAILKPSNICSVLFYVLAVKIDRGKLYFNYSIRLILPASNVPLSWPKISQKNCSKL